MHGMGMDRHHAVSEFAMAVARGDREQALALLPKSATWTPGRIGESTGRSDGSQTSQASATNAISSPSMSLSMSMTTSIRSSSEAMPFMYLVSTAAPNCGAGCI